MTPRDVLKLIEQKNVQFIDLRFMDFPGLWQHLTLPVTELTLDSFNHGFGFDGSSIRGWQAINESDMLLVPVADTALIDPFMMHTTLSMICDVRDPITKKEYSRDPRSIARKAELYLQKTKIADRAMFGPEVEFFIFDYAWYDQGINYAKYHVGSREGVWTRGDEDTTNLGQKIRLKEGYFPMPADRHDAQHPVEMVAELMNLGIPVEAHHHEVATGGQCEIDMRYQPLIRMADNVMIYKYVAKNVAARHGKAATFMPKPLFQDNGSGMHCHFSLWKGDKPLFAGNKYAGLSQMGLWAIGGILRHARRLCAITNPTTNSYKRLVPGYEAPVNLVYSSRNRSAADPHPDVQRAGGDQADRVPVPGQLVQPVPGVQRDPDGRDRRDPEQDRPRRPAGQGHVPADAGRVREAPERPGQPGGGAERAGGGPRVPAGRGRVHGRRDPLLDQVQAGERGRRDPRPAAPVRVLHVLRHLTRGTSGPLLL
jgi:glutamine synthetase